MGPCFSMERWELGFVLHVNGADTFIKGNFLCFEKKVSPSSSWSPVIRLFDFASLHPNFFYCHCLRCLLLHETNGAMLLAPQITYKGSAIERKRFFSSGGQLE